MIPDWLFFICMTLVALVIQGLFSLFEMAAVSLSKMRLQYYVSLGKKRARCLHYLLERPSRLFGTTLIGVNAALQVGSECSRRFYESLHLDPDWAPLSQLFLVVIFAELSPMFAARRHPEQLSLSLSGLMTIISFLFFPLILFFDFLSQITHRLIGKKKETPLFFSREEVKMAFEGREEREIELNALVGQIFHLKSRSVAEIMVPLTSSLQVIPSHATLTEVLHFLNLRYTPSLPIYHKQSGQIVSIVQTRDLLRLKSGDAKVIEVAQSPWFVPKETFLLDLLSQFRRNGQAMAVVLDKEGKACGIVTLDLLIAAIFGEGGKKDLFEAPFYIQRTLSADMSVMAFNQEFDAHLPVNLEEETLEDLIRKTLEHSPTLGETVAIGSFLFSVLEVTLTGIKSVSVQSLKE